MKNVLTIHRDSWHSLHDLEVLSVRSRDEPDDVAIVSIPQGVERLSQVGVMGQLQWLFVVVAFRMLHVMEREIQIAHRAQGGDRRFSCPNSGIRSERLSPY